MASAPTIGSTVTPTKGFSVSEIQYVWSALPPEPSFTALLVLHSRGFFWCLFSGLHLPLDLVFWLLASHTLIWDLGINPPLFFSQKLIFPPPFPHLISAHETVEPRLPAAIGGHTKQYEVLVDSNKIMIVCDFRKSIPLLQTFSWFLIISRLSGCSLLLNGIVIHQCVNVLISQCWDRADRKRLQCKMFYKEEPFSSFPDRSGRHSWKENLVLYLNPVFLFCLGSLILKTVSCWEEAALWPELLCKVVLQ